MKPLARQARKIFWVLFLCAQCAALAAARHAQSASAGAASATRTAPPALARIDINHAGIDQLLKVPGMTRTWAERIVRFRPYRTRQDLLDRGVLPSDVYDRIKDYVIAHRDER